MNRQQKGWQQLFLFSLLPLFLAIFGASGWLWWNWAISPAQLNAAKPQQIQIPPGTATQQIGTKLEQAGLIRSKIAWDLLARYISSQKSNGGFQAGTYELSANQPLNEIAQTIWDGKVIQVSFTIPEGWSLRQMADYFQKEKGWFSSQDFIDAASQIDRKKYPWLPADIPFLEGFLFPETYQVTKERITPQAVVQLMLERFEKTALPVYQKSQNQELNQPKFTLKQWVTLASIVEKEAVVQKERPRIAGVFVSRLLKGMKLESDPTVEYAFGIRQTPDKPLTFAQVRKPSPYNTYATPGLPPTPIAAPALESLKAVLNPESTEYLFFVARYDGTHVFSRTLPEHEAAVVKIRRERQR
ncbi:endolytic transglycosylase MltG [Brunnivagina elsteri]|uniref:Endolytic murein transglycosylase n=1 Tax=Brunnivagina elsteri CCALA 953 TaxID=987040 RepID=A0A2A2TFT6_9CYAN|nr:endolytic transglycosylase MltG [Calothrix elsteri]PAX52551.1 aminodeoxychorismate lyase [Calothrix elsteri CCALA 953]